LDLGGEALLREAMEKHEDMAENHVKPALRDLGFEVILSPHTHHYVPDHTDARNQRLSVDATVENN
jgi:hypothetical protein